MRGFERLVEIVGETAAETLCRRRGGRGIYIPDGDAGEIVRIIGVAPTRELRRAFGAGTYTVPLGPTSAQRAIRAEARALLRHGVPAGEIARRLRIHPSTVRKLKAR